MSHCQLVYLSRSNGPVEDQLLQDIRRKANGFNATQGITGALCFAYGRFLQVLEGDAQKVNDLYGKILRDPRHQKPLLLGYSRNVPRKFQMWAMKVIRLDGSTEKEAGLLVKYNQYGLFEPEHWEQEKVVSFLQEVSRILPEVA